MTLFIQHGSKEINFSKKQQLNSSSRTSSGTHNAFLDNPQMYESHYAGRLLFGGTKCQAEKKKRELYHFRIFQRVPSIQVLIRVQDYLIDVIYSNINATHQAIERDRSAYFVVTNDYAYASNIRIQMEELSNLNTNQTNPVEQIPFTERCLDQHYRSSGLSNTGKGYYLVNGKNPSKRCKKD